MSPTKEVDYEQRAHRMINRWAGVQRYHSYIMSAQFGAFFDPLPTYVSIFLRSENKQYGQFFDPPAPLQVLT